MSELLEGDDVRHSDDRDVLNVCQVNVFKESGELRTADVPMIITPRPPLADYRSKLVERIAVKGRQRRKYPKELAFSTLVIADNTRRFGAKKREHVVSALVTDQVKRVVQRSGYREVYLLTWVEESIHYFPLVMATLLSELCMFSRTLVEVGLGDVDSTEYMRMFKEFLRERMFRISTPEGEPAAVTLGGVSVALDEEFCVSVLDHYDCVAPAVASAELEGTNRLLPEGFMADYDEVAASNEFVSPLGFAARLDRW